MNVFLNLISTASLQQLQNGTLMLLKSTWNYFIDFSPYSVMTTRCWSPGTGVDTRHLDQFNIVWWGLCLSVDVSPVAECNSFLQALVNNDDVLRARNANINFLQQKLNEFIKMAKITETKIILTEMPRIFSSSFKIKQLIKVWNIILIIVKGWQVEPPGVNHTN